MRRALALAAAALAVAPSAAQALVPCPDARMPREILAGQGKLESVIVDRRGRLFFSDVDRQAFMRLDAPGATPQLVADGIEAPGGILLGAGDDLIVGQGDSIQGGAFGNVAGMAELLRIDTATGAKTVIAEGLSMANGLAYGPRGEIYASDDFSTLIDRVESDRVERGWADVVSPNGLAVNRAGTHLFVAQTFKPASLSSVELANPENVVEFAAPGPEDWAGGPDGMTIDERDRLFVAVNAAGQVWRAEPDGSLCRLAEGLGMASAVALGTGTGAFPHQHLYVVNFGGQVFEIPDVRPRPPVPAAPVAGPPAARLRLTITPRRARAGRRTRFLLRATSGGRPLAAARLRFAGRTLRTDARGRAHIRLRFTRPGRYTARFRGRGALAGTATVTVR